MSIPSVATRIAHSALITAPALTELLTSNAAIAWAAVVARHPRLRASFVPCSEGDFRIFIDDGPQAPPVMMDAPSDWGAFIQKKCNEPRWSTLWSLFILLNDHSDSARLVVFSEHVVSDGFSGLIVINDFLVALTTGQSSPPLPVNPAIMTLINKHRSCVNRLVRRVLVPVASAVAVHESKSFKAALPLMEGLENISLGSALPRHPTDAFFRIGYPANMQRAIGRAREEGTTLNGAVCTIVAMAFAHFHRIRSPSEKHFKVKIEVDYNMRKRILPSLGDDHVGLNMGMSTLKSLQGRGLRLGRSFWAQARSCKADTDAGLESFDFDLTMSFVDTRMDTDAKVVSLFHGARGCVISDANISNLGRYPFEKKFTLQSDGSLSIASIHLYNNIPNVGPSIVMFLVSTDQINYSMASKLHDSVSKDVFNMITDGIEAIGDIDSTHTVEQVMQRIAK